jgi:cell division protein FtsN
MSRDMKPRRNQPAKKKSGGGTLIGMFIGLVLGVAIAAGVVWYLNSSPLPFNKQVQAPTRSDAVATGGKGEPLALPGKPGDPVPEKRFQFYDILPGKADAVPDPATAAPAKKEEKKDDRKEEVKDSKVPLFLQAGSFSTAQDADNQKAKLAFMGVEAVVQQVMIQERTLYRVRVGPFTKIDELNKVRAELAKSGIEAQLAK